MSQNINRTKRMCWVEEKNIVILTNTICWSHQIVCWSRAWKLNIFCVCKSLYEKNVNDLCQLFVVSEKNK